MPERYKQEIEEILKEAGEPASPSGRQKPGPSLWQLIWLYVRRSLGSKSWSLSAGRLMLAGVCLLLVALLFSKLIPGVGGALALAGLLLFIVSYGMFFMKPAKVEKRWRGQPLDDGKGSWWSRFRRK